MAAFRLLQRPAWLFSVALLLNICCYSQQSTFESPPDFKRVFLKTNPLPMIQGPLLYSSEYRLGVEIVGSDRFTYELFASYLSKSLLLRSNLIDDTIRNVLDQLEYPGYRLQGQVKYYFLKLKNSKTVSNMYSPSGFYLGLHGSYSSATWRPKNIALGVSSQNWTNMNINTKLGLQIMDDERFGLDMFVGLGIKKYIVIDKDYRGNETEIPVESAVEGGLGSYFASPIKFSLGFNLAFGLL